MHNLKTQEKSVEMVRLNVLSTTYCQIEVCDLSAMLDLF